MSESELIKVQEHNQQAKKAYEAERTGALIKIGIIVVQSIAIIFLIWLAFVRFPQKEFWWTSNAKAVCKASRQDINNVHHATLAQFAQEAAVSLSSFDFLNYRKSLTAASEKYLTPRGRDQYFVSLDEAGLIETVKKNFFVVSSFVSDPPQIRDKGTKGGVPFWNIEVPITVWYASGQQRVTEKRVLTMTVVVVDPSPQNPSGIAIDNIISSQRVTQ